MTQFPPPERTYGLAIHTASPDLGLAIGNFTGDRRAQTWDLGRSLSTHLHVKLSEFLPPQTWADLAFLAVAKGPGGFTGTRMGVVTARTLAQQFGVPLFAYSTLEAAAWPEIKAQPHVDMAVQMRAQRGELYTALYSALAIAPGSEPGRLQVHQADRVMSEDEWTQILQQWPRPYHRVVADGGLGPGAVSLLEMAQIDWQAGLRPDWSEALPYYGQSPVVQSGNLGAG